MGVGDGDRYMSLDKAARAFTQLSTAEKRVEKIHEQVGALLARPFVAAGLHKLIEKEVDAIVVCERIALLFQDEKEKAAFRSEVTKRSASRGIQVRQKKKKHGVPSNKANPNNPTETV
jgi:hypothetical protein